MKRIILAAGVAALAITAPAASKPGEHGGGHGNGGAKHQERDGGKSAERQRGGHQSAQQQRNQREHRAERQNRGNQHAFERSPKQREHRVEHARKADDHRFEAQKRWAERNEKARERAFEQRERRVERIADRRRDDIRNWDRRWDDRGVEQAWAMGCPPGLAKKPVACMPPGQAKKLVGQPLNVLRQNVALRDLPRELRYVYRDTPDYYYRYGDGYMYRVNRQNDVVSALLPLFGLGYTVGQQFPSNYSNYYLPTAYQPFYPSVPQYDYRYANGYVYQVDPYSGLIRDVDPMLGYGYGYGQMLPATYSAYNVPYQYRPLYQDTSDYYYRYAPGAIYQVDPTTSLITGIAALLSNGMTVGQPLPAGYGVYNVPYDYRSQYYDTPDAWYRYANGNIYRVDPTTQLVTALVASILT